MDAHATAGSRLRANENSRVLRCLIFRSSTPQPMQSLCTLRDHCRQWPRNTRYQADATPYLGRTSTGWIAPAFGWRTHSITSSASDSSVGGTSMPSTLAVCRLMTNSNLVGCMIGRSAGFSPLRTRPTYMPTWRSAQARSIAHQPSGFGNLTKAEHRRQRVARRQGDELGATVEEKRVGADQKSIGP